MIHLVAIITVLIYSLLLLIAFRWTFLGISLSEGRFTGAMFLLKEVILVIPAIMIVPILGNTGIDIIHKPNDDDLFIATLVISYSSIAFSLTLIFLCLFCQNRVHFSPAGIDHFTVSMDGRSLVRRVSWSILLVLWLVMAYSIFLGGGQHAFLGAYYNDVSAGVIRHQNAAISGLSYIKHLIAIYTVLGGFLLSSKALDRAWGFRLVLFGTCLFASGFYGSKAPPVIFLAALAVASLQRTVQAGAWRFLRISFVWGAVGVVAIVGISLLVYGQQEGFSLGGFLFKRLLIGQMAGIYEQFSLYIYDPTYAWHAIPFASLLTEYPIFHKDLMLISEGISDPASIGVKVTHFPAEAYAIAGWIGVALAPFILALSFLLNYFLMLFFLSKFLITNRNYAIMITSLLMSFFLVTTGGVTELVFFKLTILMCILLMPCVMVSATLKWTKKVFTSPYRSSLKLGEPV
jgi:hypothetical protein